MQLSFGSLSLSQVLSFYACAELVFNVIFRKRVHKVYDWPNIKKKERFCIAWREETLKCISHK